MQTVGSATGRVVQYRAFEPTVSDRKGFFQFFRFVPAKAGSIFWFTSESKQG